MNTCLVVTDLAIDVAANRLIDDFNLVLRPHERVAICGPSGIGKTTLLMALMGFTPFIAGSINLLGVDMVSAASFDGLRGPVGFMFQNADDQLFCPTVIDDVRFGPLNMDRSPKQATDIAVEMLKQLGISHLRDRPCSGLSGGQKRLVALAGVLAMGPQLLLLDEPTSSLDAASADRVVQALLNCGLPMLFSTHDAWCIEQLATRSVTLG